MNAPERVFMDERVAARMPASESDAAEEIGQDVEVVAYWREDIVLERIREGQAEAEEFAVQFEVYGVATLPDNSGTYAPLLVVLSNFGRIRRQVQIEDGDAEAGQRIVWEAVEVPELKT